MKRPTRKEICEQIIHSVDRATYDGYYFNGEDEVRYEEFDKETLSFILADYIEELIEGL